MERPKRQRKPPAHYIGWYGMKMLTASRDKQRLDSMQADVTRAENRKST